MEVVHAQWPPGNTCVRWDSPINDSDISWHPNLYAMSSAVKGMGAKRYF